MAQSCLLICFHRYCHGSWSLSSQCHCMKLSLLSVHNTDICYLHSHQDRKHPPLQLAGAAKVWSMVGKNRPQTHQDKPKSGTSEGGAPELFGCPMLGAARTDDVGTHSSMSSVPCSFVCCSCGSVRSPSATPVHCDNIAHLPSDGPKTSCCVESCIHHVCR